MKKTISLFVLTILMGKGYCQETFPGFKTETVDKKLSEFPDRFDLSSPLNSFITFNYAYINGKNRLYQSISSAKRRSECPDSIAADSETPQNLKDWHLNARINEIIVYKDSVAGVISQYPTCYSLRTFYLESGKWVNVGEDLFTGMENARVFCRTHAELFYEDLQNIYEQFLTPVKQP